MRFQRITWVIPIILMVMLTAVVVFAQAPDPSQLIASGGGFNLVQDPLIFALKLRAEQQSLSRVEILVLPVGVGSNSNTITDAERTAQLTTAEQQRQEIEANCQDALPQGATCSALLVPVITRTDALASPALKDFSPNPDAIVFLQNNAQRILETIRETGLAEEIASAYQAGTTILYGPANLFSTRFIRGYSPSFAPASALTFGAVLAGDGPERGGLGVFPAQAILDTHPFSENRLGQLLNSITGPAGPHIGIGVEAGTSFHFVEDREMLGFYGESVVAILDAETYHSANAVTYQPGTNLMGLRNILLHLVAPGTTIYNLVQRESSIAPSSPQLTREFDGLDIPAGAGAVMLTSNLLADTSGMQSLNEFTNLSGGQNARLLILAAGFTDSQSAQEHASAIASQLEVPSELMVIQTEAGEPLQIDPGITGIILTGQDIAEIQTDDLQEIKNRWLSGIPVLGDQAGAAILGLHFTSSKTADQALPPFTPGRYQLLTGLGFVQANIEPLALTSHSWERSITSSYLFPETLSIGLAPGAALKIDSETASILGTNVVTLVDLRTATITTGESGIYEIANGLLDIYTPGEQIQALVADAEAAPIHAPTPQLAVTTPPPEPTPTATLAAEVVQPEPTEAPRTRPPTRTPRPTGTPVPTPPPSDPGTTNLMVFFGVLSVVVVIVGVWLNRQIAVE